MNKIFLKLWNIIKQDFLTDFGSIYIEASNYLRTDIIFKITFLFCFSRLMKISKKYIHFNFIDFENLLFYNGNN
jgi:hypothetical protein